MEEALREIDRALGRMFTKLNDKGIYDQINIIITSDHGMTEISEKRVVLLDDYIDLSAVEVVDWSPIAAIIPEDGCLLFSPSKLF